MDIKGEKVLNSPVHRVWVAMNDPRVLAKCIPGCKSLAPIDSSDSRFQVVIQVGVGALKGTLTGTIAISERVPDSSYRLAVNARSPLGFTRMDGRLGLTPEGQRTKLSHAVNAQIGGLAAAVGQQIMGGAANKFIDQFFSCLEKELESQRSS